MRSQPPATGPSPRLGQRARAGADRAAAGALIRINPTAPLGGGGSRGAGWPRPQSDSISMALRRCLPHGKRAQPSTRRHTRPKTHLTDQTRRSGRHRPARARRVWREAAMVIQKRQEGGGGSTARGGPRRRQRQRRAGPAQTDRSSGSRRPLHRRERKRKLPPLVAPTRIVGVFASSVLTLGAGSMALPLL